jgi:hypothetical protein
LVPPFLNSRERAEKTFQSILIVGAGSSAYDIGREIAFVAKRVYLSVRPRRNGCQSVQATPWEKVVHSIMPDNILQMPEITKFGPINMVENMCDAEIFLDHGMSLRDIDFVIFCTGYRFSLPFLPAHQARTTHEKVVDQRTIISNGVQLHNLHKDLFFISDPTLAFIGVPFEIATFSFFDIQAIAAAAVFSCRAVLPNKQQMYEEYEHRKRSCGTGKMFHILGLEKEILYIKEVLQWVNGSSAQPRWIGYEGTLNETRRRQTEAFKELVMSTTVLRGKDQEELKRIIAKKVEELEQEEARVGNRT